MMVVAVESSPTFRAGIPRVLFEGDYGDETVPLAHNYDISRDGQRFLMLAPATGAEQSRSRIVVVEEWHEELKRLVPRN